MIIKESNDFSHFYCWTGIIADSNEALNEIPSGEILVEMSFP